MVNGSRVEARHYLANMKIHRFLFPISSCFNVATVESTSRSKENVKTIKPRRTSNRVAFATSTGPVRVASEIERRSSSRGECSLKSARASREQSASPATFIKRRSFVTNDRLVKTLKRDSWIRRRFESFAERQYASENVGFIKSVLEWKTERAGDYNSGRDILETYISTNAPLQVNISYATRVGVEMVFEELNVGERIPSGVFDDAMAEISSMMVEGGIWGTFVWKGGCDNYDIDVPEENCSKNAVAII